MRNLRRAIQRLIRKNGGGRGNSRRLKAETQIPPVQLPKTYVDAAQGLVDRQTLKSVKWRNQIVKTPIEGMHPEMAKFGQKLTKELAARGYPFFVFEYYRDPIRQDRLFNQGVSKARGGQSPHNYGLACDLVHATRYWDLTRREWAVVGAIGKEVARRMKLKIEWGGDWNFYDPAHWQMAGWKKYRAALSEMREAGCILSDEEDGYFAQIENWIKASR